MIDLVLYACLAGQAAASEATHHLQAGLEARKQHQIEVEITEFRKATELDPALADAYVNLGAAFMEKRDYGSAIAPLKHALALNPELPIAHQLLGYALLSQGNATEAIPHLEKAGAQEALGVAQIETGQLNDAVLNFSAALAKHPEDPDLLYYLGHSSGLLSKSAIDRLLVVAPDSARAHQALAENYFALRQMPQAEREYREAIRIRPDLPGLHLELGQVYANSARWPEAEEEFRSEAQIQPASGEVAYRLGAALLQQGKVREARPELARSNSIKPEMPETLYSLGKAASLEGDFAAAENAWLKVIELEKQTALAAQSHFGLAAIYRKQGKTAQAQQQMQEFQRLQSKIGPPRAQ